MSTPQTSEAAPPARRRRIWIALAGGVLALLLAVRVALPEVAAALIEGAVSDRLRGRLSVENIDLGLWAGRIQIDGLSAAPGKPGTEPLARVGRVFVDLGWWGLLDREIHLERVELDRVEVGARRDAEGAIDLATLFESVEVAAEEPAAEPEPETDARPWRIRLDDAALSDARLAWRDDAPGLEVGLELARLDVEELAVVLADALRGELGRTDLDDARIDYRGDDGDELGLEIDLEIASLRWDPNDPGAPGNIDLEIEPVDGGRLRLDGDVEPSRLAGRLRLEWEELPLPKLVVLADGDVRRLLRDGRSSGALDLGLDPDAEAAGLGVSGDVRLDGLAIEREQPGPIRELRGRFEQIAIELERVLVPLARDGSALALDGTPSVELGTISVRSPAVTLVRAAAAASAQAEAETAVAGSEAPAEEGDAPVDVRLAHLAITDGVVRLEDETFQPSHETVVDAITFDLRDAHWPGNEIGGLKLVLGSLGSEPLTLTGAGRREDAKLRLTAGRVSLLPAAAYVRQASAYELTGGSLSIDSEIALVGERYDAPTEVVFHDFALTGAAEEGDPFTEQIGVPPDVALALLRDADGDITFDLPVAGDREGGGVAVASVVRDTLRRTLINALAAPLKLAGALMPGEGGGESFEPRAVQFEPGTGVPIGDDVLADLAAMLSDRPGLGLRIEARVVEADLNRLAEEDSRLREKDGQASAAGRARLRRLAKQRTEAVRAGLIALLPPGAVPDGRLVQVPWPGELDDGKPRALSRPIAFSSRRAEPPEAASVAGQGASPPPAVSAGPPTRP